MSKGPEIDAAAARKVADNCSEFKLPKAPEGELKALSREEWMARYGGELQSEQWFDKKAPGWNYDKSSWWFKSVGRDGEAPPLWMRQQWHMPELDCPQGWDPQADTLDERRAAGRTPLWAERMNLSGSKQGPQSATIYGHRAEYRPAQKTDARSMYERYQPAYERILNEELPDASDPPDGRYWKSGVAQGVSASPYEKRMVTSGRRKPVVVGQRSAAVVVDAESHSLGAAVTDVAWLHPHTELAAYTTEHPVYRHINMRMQTTASSGVGGEQALAEVLHMTQDIFGVVGDKMAAAAAAELERQQQRQAAIDKV
ncbi:DNA-directed RNA polymerase I and III 14 KDA polypeptide [Micractinium conductrix]|uniref:DNA-directed RNA polymerase I and III 14 kDa polypeptide n=1 Tax=Micractinium conductrix TaxID=554055 RepID=A0A2P6V6J6_9CHLO|nr:DNA-directed RNA polymerase I and III 14 KDA polypeptide [Micractinium conductrix]|eukprot:PSC69710.1 DNA-directed RNA polymerase I and III 14 KDA polypeptide [Micractinium conductrix]